MSRKKIHLLEDFLAIHLISPVSLKPHEQCCPYTVKYWLEQISLQLYWTRPLLIHKHTNIIMDGHHRHQVAQMLGLKYIPCIMTSYANPYVRVYSYADNSMIDNQRIIEAGQTGKLFEKKSTRHEVKVNCIPEINIPLTFLQ